MSLPQFSSQWDLSFRSSPFRLRVELGREDLAVVGAQVPHILRALSRATLVASDVFETSHRLFGFVTAYGRTPARIEMGFAGLRDAGFAPSFIAEWIKPTGPNEDEDVLACTRVFDLSDDTDSRDVLLWFAVASDIGINPAVDVKAVA